MFDFLQRMGSAVCHQMAERSLYFDGMQMPLCARCTGIYIGAFFAFCYLFLRKRMQAGKSFSMVQAVLTALMILPVGIDGIGSYMSFWESSQLMRILTGSLVGAVVPGFLLMAGNFEPKWGNEIPVYENTVELLFLMTVSIIFGICLWSGLPLCGIGAVISVIGEILIWSGLVWLLLKNLFEKWRIPCWKASLAISFIGLFVVGGLSL